MLASDINNPEFVGAISNPDAALIVEFYIKPVQNIFHSSKQGKPVFEDVAYVRINVPGLKEMMVDTPARSDHQKRFPMQWQHFIHKTQGDAREIGTPVAEWTQLTRSQAEEFRSLKFFTVEAVANAADAQINALGMIGGMSPYMLREKARAFLQSAKDSALPQHQAEELAKRDAEIALLKEQIAQIASKVGATPAQPVVAPTIPVPAPRKRGRPSKADLAARAAAQGVQG